MLLDASFVIDLMEGRPEAVALAAALDREDEPLRLPAPVLFELWVGAANAVRGGADRQRLEEFVLAYAPLEFSAEDARAAGQLQSTLARAGKGLGTLDALIAGMAIARSEPLVTGDRILSRLGRGVPVRTYRNSD